MSASLKEIFESELKRKLTWKTKQSTSDSILLFNTFKFYDVWNNGFVNRTQWQQVYAKWGLNGFTGADFNELFKIYDVDNKGCIDYKKFALGLYGEPLHQVGGEQKVQNQQMENNGNSSNNYYNPQFQYQPPQVPQQEQRLQRNFEESVNNNQTQNNRNKSGNMPHTPLRNEVKTYFKALLSTIQREVNKYNGITYYVFYSKIKELEESFSHRISFDNWWAAFATIKADVAQKDIFALFSLLDWGDNGKIISDELLAHLRGQMNERRKSAVINAFIKYDSDKKGIINITDWKGNFNAQEHPDIKWDWVKNPNEIYDAFLYIFDIFCSAKGWTREGLISFDNFLEFYDGISASIENDDYFCDIISSVWGWHSNPFPNKPIEPSQNTSNTHKSPSQPNENWTGEAWNKLRFTVISRGQKGIFGLILLAKIIDTNNTGILSVDDFAEWCWKYKIDLHYEEIRSLCLDKNMRGINYTDLFKAIYGEMNDNRKRLVFSVFKRLSRNNEFIDINQLRSLYTSFNHPEVINKKRTPEEIYGEFLDNLESFWFYMGKNKNDKTFTFNEFVEFYNMISMSIQDDGLFEILVNNSWK